MSFRTVKSIEKAFDLAHTKKENLKQAFEQLQSQSSLLASFKLNWTEIDSYFTSFESELLDKFSILQTLESSRISRSEKQSNLVSSEPVPARPELKALCEKMDGVGFLRYVFERPKERTALRVELADALKHAPNPGSLVLDAMEGYWDGKHVSVSKVRTTCVMLLEELMRAGVEIPSDVKDRAMGLAAEWKRRILDGNSGGADDEDDEDREDDGGLEKLGYLQILATYKLLDDVQLEEDELMDYVVSSARYRPSINLCRSIGIDGIVREVIQRLITKGKQLVALKFVFEYGLIDEFPPVPLLKACVLETRKIAQKVRKHRRNSYQTLNDAGLRESNALKSVIKCIEEHNLETEFPTDELVARLDKLEKDKADRKRSVRTPLPKPQQQVRQPKENGNKRMRPLSRPSSFNRKRPANNVAHPPRAPGLLPGHAAAYLPPPAGAYGMAGAVVAAAPYVGSSVDHGLPGAHVGFPGNPNPSASNPYPSETHAQPGYYDRTIYAGYDVASQYHHPAFYPQ